MALKFFLYLVLLAALAICVGSNPSLVLRQPVERGGSASGWRPDAKPKEARCEPSQARYGSKCYAELAKVSLDCELDLGGEGSLDTLCRLRSSVTLGASSFIVGAGALEIEHHVSISCAAPGCEVVVLLAKSLVLAPGSAIRGGSLTIQAANVTVLENASITTTALGGAGASGSPPGIAGAGAGHGGRGASCVDDFDGGDIYAWETLAAPWSHGSRGGSTNESILDLGGAGGGRIAIATRKLLLNDTVESNGGSVGLQGGGGSGGSIAIKALTMYAALFSSPYHSVNHLAASNLTLSSMHVMLWMQRRERRDDLSLRRDRARRRRRGPRRSRLQPAPGRRRRQPR